MNTSELINAINDKLDLGWTTKTSDRGAIWLEQQDGAGNIKVILWPYTRKIKGLCLGASTSGYMAFKEVESILEKYYKEFSLENLNYSIHFSSIRNEQFYASHVGSKDDLEAILPILKNMVFDEILPFFDRYQTIQQVYEKMESMDVMEMSSFIYNPMPIRRMILKRLVNAADFEEYGQKIVLSFEEGSKGPHKGSYAPFAQFLPELFEELKAMQV